VLCTEWPTTEISLQNIQASKKTPVTMLGVEAPVPTRYKSGKLTILAPKASPAQVKGKFAYVFKVENVL
jgi:hypothetical protein